MDTTVRHSVPSAVGYTHASSVTPLVTSSEAESGTVTQSFTPSNDSALPERPIVHEGPEGRSFQRFGGDDVVENTRRAEQLLDENPSGAVRAVMVCDGYLDIDGVKHDALLARIVEYGSPPRRLSVVVPSPSPRPEALREIRA